MQTFDGIDMCGKRLAAEIQEVIAANPQLQYISMVGHSMGGLLIRYAAGYLYDKDEKLIAGLTPVISPVTDAQSCLRAAHRAAQRAATRHLCRHNPWSR